MTIDFWWIGSMLLSFFLGMLLVAILRASTDVYGDDPYIDEGENIGSETGLESGISEDDYIKFRSERQDVESRKRELARDFPDYQTEWANIWFRLRTKKEATHEQDK